MAQVKLLKISSVGTPAENATADDVTFASFTVTGGGPVLGSTGLDMNTQAVSDASGYAVTTPASQGIAQTAGTLAMDNIVGKERSNTLTTAADILFPIVTDTAGQVDMLRLPQLAGVPSATPTASGEGFLVWNSSANKLYAWDGAAWTNDIAASASSANKVVDSTSYTADTAGVAVRDALYISAAGKVLAATASAESTGRVIGFATGAASSGGAVSAQSAGVLTGFTALTAGAPYYLSTSAGTITATPPSGSGNEVVLVGYAASTTSLEIRIQRIGTRA
jgi:hypothetical protein